MNLADYLSELLAQQDEVTIPGLGYFVRTRVNAYYNSAEGRFYPPCHRVNFVAQPKDDDTFAQYVADKKNISLASSRYFIEKFVAKLREDASKGKYLFADLGSFRSELDQLIFKPNDKIHADPAFYGYPPVDIRPVNQPVAVPQREPVFASPAATQAAIPPAISVQTPEPEVRLSHQPQYYEEETEPRRRISAWLIILIVLAVLAAAIFGIYQFYPSAFNKAKQEFYKITSKTAVAPAIIKHKSAPDTVKKSMPVSDTTVKSVSSITPADTVKQLQYEAVAFELPRKKAAEIKIKELMAKGYAAHMILNTPGSLFKVSAGTYSSFEAADSAEQALIKNKTINKHYYPITVQP